MKAKATMKCQVRADCRPPSRSTMPASSASICGDIASPVSSAAGASTKMTAR